jgi:hypothetical protein
MMCLMGYANWWMPKWVGVALRIPVAEPLDDVPEVPAPVL